MKTLRNAERGMRSRLGQLRIADCGLRVGRVAALVWAAMAAAVQLSGQASLSIYSDGRVVVRRTFAQPLQKGRNLLTLSIEGLDPATLFSPDSGLTITSAQVRYPSPRGEALTRAVGQTLSFVRGRLDTVKATVVRVDPPQYRLPDGRLLLSEPGEPLFPADFVRTAPEARLVVDAARSRSTTELAWVGQGVTWEATYQAVVGAASAGVSGAATVLSQALRADSAEVQLVAGSVNRARGGPPQSMVMADMAMARAAEAKAMPTEEGVGETHVYTLPARLSLEPGVPVTTALFPRAAVPVVREYVVPGVLPWRGWFGPQPTDPYGVPVQVWHTFRHSAGTPFGDRPLPGGTIQIYQPDSDGRLQLIGEAGFGHTPAGKDLRVQSGDAFDVSAERVQTDFAQEQIPPARRGLPATQRITASYRVSLSNARDEAVTVDVRESHVGTWRVTESSVPAEKLSSTESRFRVRVPANGQATLTYTVQVES